MRLRDHTIKNPFMLRGSNITRMSTQCLPVSTDRDLTNVYRVGVFFLQYACANVCTMSHTKRVLDHIGYIHCLVYIIISRIFFKIAYTHAYYCMYVWYLAYVCCMYGSTMSLPDTQFCMFCRKMHNIVVI